MQSYRLGEWHHAFSNNSRMYWPLITRVLKELVKELEIMVNILCVEFHLPVLQPQVTEKTDAKSNFADPHLCKQSSRIEVKCDRLMKSLVNYSSRKRNEYHKMLWHLDYLKNMSFLITFHSFMSICVFRCPKTTLNCGYIKVIETEYLSSELTILLKETRYISNYHGI